MTYSEIQFKLGKPKAKYNSFNEKWFPAIGGAVNFTVAFADCESATKRAEYDYKHKRFNHYE